jgi:hypothetical protein
MGAPLQAARQPHGLLLLLLLLVVLDQGRCPAGGCILRHSSQCPCWALSSLANRASPRPAAVHLPVPAERLGSHADALQLVVRQASRSPHNTTGTPLQQQRTTRSRAGTTTPHPRSTGMLTAIPPTPHLPPSRGGLAQAVPWRTHARAAPTTARPAMPISAAVPVPGHMTALHCVCLPLMYPLLPGGALSHTHP